MPVYAAITLEYDTKKRIDLALPMDVPSQALAEAIAGELHLPAKSYALFVQTEDARRIPANATLGDMAILDGMILRLEAVESIPPRRARSATGAAYLQTESGETFSLNKSLLYVGRSDPKRGIFPDIDLKPYDPERTVTRRWHAQIERKDDGYWLTDLKSTNGTRLNGRRLPPNQPQELHDGDVIAFGRGVMQLVFKSK